MSRNEAVSNGGKLLICCYPISQTVSRFESVSPIPRDSVTMPSIKKNRAPTASSQDQASSRQLTDLPPEIMHMIMDHLRASRDTSTNKSVDRNVPCLCVRDRSTDSARTKQYDSRDAFGTPWDPVVALSGTSKWFKALADSHLKPSVSITFCKHGLSWCQRASVVLRENVR
jgi:hypothetical protein